VGKLTRIQRTRPIRVLDNEAKLALAMDTPSGKTLFSNASQVLIQVRCLLYCHGNVEDAMKIINTLYLNLN
jgi:hypothetical protein